MTDFFSIPIKEIKKSTASAVVITLDIPDHLKEVFNYKAGQYITIKQTINEEELRRSYSLCSSPVDQEWKIGVKQIENGRFSTFANQKLKKGDVLEVMKPQGNFTMSFNKTNKKNYIAFAAGSGITPILSLIKTQLNVEDNSNFTLFFANKSVANIMLKEEIESLKNQFMDRFQIYYFLSKEMRSTPLFNGRIDINKLEQLSKTLCQFDTVDECFICGPEDMIFLIKDFLIKEGLNEKNIHFELFGTNANKQNEQKLQIAEKLKGKVCQISVLEGGKQIKFTIEQGSLNVLDAALNNSADLPFACKGGVCATCKAKVIEGSVDMLLSYGLEQDEIDDGYVLTCQSIPTSEKLIIDFDI